MTPELEVLLEESHRRGHRSHQSDLLSAFYGGILALPEATPAAVIANLVITVDGVATFDRDHASGAAAVSQGSRADRLLMAMLRAAADVILIGATTLRVTVGHRWTASAPVPELRAELDEARRQLTGASEPPHLVVVSAGGDIPLHHPGLQVPGARAMVITTEQGSRRMGPPGKGIRVVVAGEGGAVPPAEIMAIIQREMSPRLLLTEGGPGLLGNLLSAGLVDELFLTLTPVIAGRTSASVRPGLVDGFAFSAGEAPRLWLLSLRMARDGALFFRYRLR
ncbi:MAG: dihydrofolate reductase family protein [Candidatus Dormibacteria bacterium]